MELICFLHVCGNILHFTLGLCQGWALEPRVQLNRMIRMPCFLTKVLQPLWDTAKVPGAATLTNLNCSPLVVLGKMAFPYSNCPVSHIKALATPLSPFYDPLNKLRLLKTKASNVCCLQITSVFSSATKPLEKRDHKTQINISRNYSATLALYISTPGALLMLCLLPGMLFPFSELPEFCHLQIPLSSRKVFLTSSQNS